MHLKHEALYIQGLMKRVLLNSPISLQSDLNVTELIHQFLLIALSLAGARSKAFQKSKN